MWFVGKQKEVLSHKNQQKNKDPKQNESIENKSRNMHGRDKKEEHKGEKKCSVSKGVPKSSEQMKQSTSFLESKMPEASCYRNDRGLYSAMNGQKA
jgi:hypothetical protein